jgi:hypothetical protein
MIRKRKKNGGEPQQKRPEGLNRWMLGYAYTPSSILQALYLAMAVTFLSVASIIGSTFALLRQSIIYLSNLHLMCTLTPTSRFRRPLDGTWACDALFLMHYFYMVRMNDEQQITAFCCPVLMDAYTLSTPSLICVSIYLHLMCISIASSFGASLGKLRACRALLM